MVIWHAIHTMQRIQFDKRIYYIISCCIVTINKRSKNCEKRKQTDNMHLHQMFAFYYVKQFESERQTEKRIKQF